jgi:hypothetical protein
MDMNKEIKELNEINKINEINTRINNEICYNTITDLRDDKLIREYVGSKSVKNEIKKLEYILDKYISNEIKEKIIEDYLLELIPTKTKRVIRGNKFNIKNLI